MKKLLSLLMLLIVAIGTSWGAITQKTITSSTGEVYLVTPANMYSYYNSGNGWATNASGGAIGSDSYYASKSGNSNTNYINPETEKSGTTGQASGITLKTKDDRSARFYFTGAVKATAFIAITGSGRTATITVYKVSDNSQVGSTTGQSYGSSGAYEKLEVPGLTASESYYAKVTATNDLCLYAMKFFAPSAPSVPTLTGAWKIGEDDVTGETADVVQGATAPSIPTFTVGATSGTPTTDNYQVAYSETGDEGIFTYTDGVPTGISTTNEGSATITATLTTKDNTKYLTPETNTFTYTVSVSAAQAPSKPTITGVPEAAVAKNASVTLTASSTGTPNPTYQWYTCDSEGGNQAEITGAGEASYSPATTSLGTTYYIVKASNSVQSGVASDVVAIQVVGSSECKLTEVKYSNGFNAFINESANTVKAYYLAGTSAPTVSSTQISTGATVDTSNPSSIVVTAEDGTTTATYAVEVSSVEPYSGIGRTFDGSESWIKTGGAYTTISGEKVYYAWVINKNATNDDRIPLGKTRIYFFVDNAASITLINDRGTNLNADRAIKVYVNGELQDAPTTMPKKDTDHPAPQITITTGSAAMVEIASNQTKGDTGWGKIVVNGTSMNLPLNDGGNKFTKGFTTFCSPANFTVSEGATAYKAAIADSKLTMTALEGIIPANTGVVIAGSKNTNATIATTTAAATADVTDNDLKGTTAAALTADLKGTAAKFLAFKKSTSTFTPYGGENFPANKAYLLLDSNNDSQSLEMVFEEATGINNVNAAETEAQAAPVKVIKNGKLYIGNYNVAGQLVK